MTEEIMREYYAQRAEHLEQVYERPERLADLQEMQNRICELLKNHQVLEVACGTGYWTEKFAPYAASVVATDINQSMLNIAQTKSYPSENTTFDLVDLYELPDATAGQYSACFAGFFWSHVKREEQSALLTKLSKGAGKGSLLLLIVKLYLEITLRISLGIDFDWKLSSIVPRKGCMLK